MASETSPEILGQAAVLIHKGVKRSVVMERLGVSRTTLTKYFPASPKPVHKPFEVNKWAEALDEGMGYKHVAEVFGVSARTVRKYLPGRGWTPQQVREHAALMRRSRAMLG